MHHRMGYLDPGWPTIGENTSSLTPQQWDEPRGIVFIGWIQLDGCGQLPFETGNHRSNLVQTGAAYHQ
jgi:hypothetical protein